MRRVAILLGALTVAPAALANGYHGHPGYRGYHAFPGYGWYRGHCWQYRSYGYYRFSPGRYGRFYPGLYGRSPLYVPGSPYAYRLPYVYRPTPYCCYGF
jgi:hypothetical protein